MTTGIDVDDCETACGLCCCLPCTLISYVCCCRRMRKSRKIQIFWGWLLAVAVAIGLIFGIIVYGPVSTNIAPSDMRVVAENMHFLFCDEAEVKSPDMTFNAYIVKTPVSIDTVNRELYFSEDAIFVSENNFTYFSFYLLPTSTMTLDHCSESPITFYVFKGDSNFRTLTEDGVFDYYYDKVSIDGQSSCVRQSSYRSFKFVAEEESQYYMVYSNEYDNGAWVDLNVHLNRSSYDLSNARSICSSVSMYDVTLNGPEEAVVIAMEDYYSVSDHLHSSVTIQCVPRIWAYLLILGFGVLLVGVTASVLIQKLCKDTDLIYQGRHRSREFERAPLLYDVHPPSYDSVCVTPPKYEDIYRGNDVDMDLPSYLEAVHALHRTTNSPRMDVSNSTTAVTSSCVIGTRVCQNPGQGYDVTNERRAIETSETYCSIQSSSPAVSNSDNLQAAVQNRGPDATSVSALKLTSNRSSAILKESSLTPGVTSGSVHCVHAPRDTRHSLVVNTTSHQGAVQHGDKNDTGNNADLRNNDSRQLGQNDDPTVHVSTVSSRLPWCTGTTDCVVSHDASIIQDNQELCVPCRARSASAPIAGHSRASF